MSQAVQKQKHGNTSFLMGAWNWKGGAIRKGFTEAQINDAVPDENDNVSMNYDKLVNIDVGLIAGQTGWTGVNQAGEKTMSYQIAIIIKANDGFTLQDIFAVNREEGQATQLGWWIPSRGENDPPEKWTMNLADIYLKTDVTASTIEMRQTKWEAGLYDSPGSSIDGYKQTLDPKT